ncbi:class I SAM-dependent methyltransferase [Streptoalloteichus hindustanus]|uniref:SAM-dependent methyltransferase n=1 Tax=Streptoalloteichus hindustanus TaxID=2017 RepID=A0A1M5HZ97_STRHI|nr:class I SAM-dependent methyltransferase [Streptoalloteichus hindustanus]SHG21129.1 SAM-dependent methyltransferase [Streptoalloteichus hindustanus]
MGDVQRPWTGPARRLPVAGSDYRDAFTTFLAGTDEKELAHPYLLRVVANLPSRRVLLDVGAGDGTTTRLLGPHFERTLCVEPSAPMRELLRRSCPDAVVLSQSVLDAEVDVPVDLALLSHVLYYVPEERWASTVLRIMGWLRPGGRLVILMQNPDNPCMRMVQRFTGARFDLSSLPGRLRAAAPELVGTVRLDTLPARYRTASLPDALAVAEFFVSVPQRDGQPLEVDRGALWEYVSRHFADGDGGYTVPHTQDVLHLWRPGPSEGTGVGNPRLPEQAQL